MAETIHLNTSIGNPASPAIHLANIEDIEPYPEQPVTCSSKNCIHKTTMRDDKETTKENKKNKKKRRSRKRKEESDSESSSDGEQSDTSSSESTESDEDTSDSDSSSSEEETSRKSKKSKSKKSKTKKVLKKIKGKKDKSKSKKKDEKSRQVKYNTETETSNPSSSGETPTDDASSDGFSGLKQELESQGLLKGSKKAGTLLKEILKLATRRDADDDTQSMRSKKSERSSKSQKTKSKEKDRKAKEEDSSKAKYKRLDEIWDEDLYDYRLRETTDKEETDEFDKYIFTVRRKFDVENHYQNTVVDVKSTPLIECLKIVFEGVPGVSLVEKTPRLMPDLLFMYLDDLKEYSQTLTTERKRCPDKKVRKVLKAKAQHLDVLISYIDKDYDEVKKTLYPLLDSGIITFDLLWILYKPNSMVYKTTYGADSQPRAFRIEYATKERDYSKGLYYDVEGKYFDYDGENFGWAYINAEVTQFPGARKITSLPCYPLKYHQKHDTIQVKLIDRGKQFLILAGMNYKYCKGLCFQKKENKILKVNIDGRVMIDPKTFRRINPNYPLSEVDAREVEEEAIECRCEKPDQPHKNKKSADRLFLLDKDEKCVIEMSPSDPRAPNNITDPIKRTEAAHLTFTEEELLCSSPLLPGFSFSEKMWIEITVASLTEVPWNEGAFDALVLPEKHKSIIKALVSAHVQFASQSIDDVVSGKGKGLVAVLHGKPGLGKTLTCEAVADLLKRPLYAVSAGDLGTSSTHLEFQLQTILDIAHTWGAVLLLDEADVFLEERSNRDISRNALVSVFLRLLEYNQGILVLTTNRVETFDEAFVSRIHLSLRYGELTIPARKAIWKTFIKKVAAAGAPTEAIATSASSSEVSSAGMPTPATTLSTPNSGTATPAPVGDALADPPTTPTTASVVSIESADSDKTVTMSPAVSKPAVSATEEPPSTTVEKITEANFMELARIELNGRQIKNLVKTAQALALYEGVPMGMGHLRRCIEVGRSFELDLKGGRGWEDVMRSYT